MHRHLTQLETFVVGATASCAIMVADAHANERDGAFAIRGGSAFSAVYGEAYSAIGGDADAMFWNPAALITTAEPHTQATYHDVYSLGLARYTSLSFVWRPTREELVMEGDSIRVVQHRNLGTAYGGSLGFLALDLDGASYYEASPALAVALPLKGGAAIGISARYLRTSSTLEGVSANGYAIEVGVHQSVGRWARIGLALRNLAAQLDWNSGNNESLPRELNFALALTPLRRITLAGGAVSDLDGDGEGADHVNGALALHVWPGHLTVAGGWEARRSGDDLEGNWIAGARVRAAQIGVDYAFVPGEETPGETHRITLDVYF